MTDAAPAFSGIHLFARDVAASAAFYRLVGLDLPDAPDHVVAQLSNGATLAIGSHELTRGYHPNWQASRGGTPNALQFDLASRDAVDEMYRRLTAAGYRAELAPIDAFWGSRYAEIEDPDGNLVGFHSPRDDAHRSAPPPLG